MKNRVLIAFASMKLQIENRIKLGLTTRNAVAKVAARMDMDASEHAKFQELKSAAIFQKKLTLEEAQTIYNHLGETVATFNSQPVWVKYVLTGLFKELLEKQLETSE